MLNSFETTKSNFEIYSYNNVPWVTSQPTLI